MKLSIAQVRKFKKDFIELNGERETKGSTIMSLIETIEALQQENNGWRERYDELDAGHSRLFKDFCKLRQENERLQAQVARMRKALIIANNYMPDIGQFCVCGKCKGCGTDIGYSGYEYCLKCARGIIDAAISDAPADYHNPADVEALRKAREALNYWRELYGTGLEVLKWHMNGNTEPFDSFYNNSGTYEALAEIDKAIGGKQDV